MMRDVYVVIAEPVGEGNQTKWGVHVYVNPLVEWIWLGGLVILLGVGFTLSFRVRARATGVST